MKLHGKPQYIVVIEHFCRINSAQAGCAVSELALLCGSDSGFYLVYYETCVTKRNGDRAFF